MWSSSTNQEPSRIRNLLNYPAHAKRGRRSRVHIKHVWPEHIRPTAAARPVPTALAASTSTSTYISASIRLCPFKCHMSETFLQFPQGKRYDSESRETHTCHSAPPSKTRISIPYTRGKNAHFNLDKKSRGNWELNTFHQIIELVIFIIQIIVKPRLHKFRSHKV